MPIEFLKQFKNTSIKTATRVQIEHIEISFAPFDSFVQRVTMTLDQRAARECRLADTCLQPSPDEEVTTLRSPPDTTKKRDLEDWQAIGEDRTGKRRKS